MFNPGHIMEATILIRFSETGFLSVCGSGCPGTHSKDQSARNSEILLLLSPEW